MNFPASFACYWNISRKYESTLARYLMRSRDLEKVWEHMRQVGEYLAAALLKENHPRFLKICARSSTLASSPARALSGGGVIGMSNLMSRS